VDKNNLYIINFKGGLKDKYFNDDHCLKFFGMLAGCQQ